MILLLFIFQSTCFCQNVFANSGVIDLGEMSVEGELRRPSITWIDSQKPVNSVLGAYMDEEFERFESSLLHPATHSVEGSMKSNGSKNESSQAGTSNRVTPSLGIQFI